MDDRRGPRDPWLEPLSSRRYAGTGQAHRWRNLALALGLLLSVLLGVAGSLAYSALSRHPAEPTQPGGAAATQAPESPTATIAS